MLLLLLLLLLLFLLFLLLLLLVVVVFVFVFVVVVVVSLTPDLQLPPIWNIETHPTVFTGKICVATLNSVWRRSAIWFVFE